MGTNYYWHESGERECPHCGHETKNLHIGKSSWGWNFSLRVHPYEGIYDLPDWEAKWNSAGAIFDEYGELVTAEEMRKIILDRPPESRSHVGLQWSEAREGGPTYDLCNYEFC